MPPAGTRALSNFLNSAAGSSSRKRSHAEITRSESRSRSPDHLPSKRRRISPTTIFDSNPSPPPSREPTADPLEPIIRFEGDGYDYRRPIMATQTRRATATPIPNDVVDLTGDSDNDDASTASESSLRQVSRQSSSHRSRSERVASWQQAAYHQQRRAATERLMEAQRQGADERHLAHLQQQIAHEQQQAAQRQQDHHPLAPPFVQRPHEQASRVIVLSDSESELEIDDFDIPSDIDTNDSDSVASLATTPEVQFVEERRVPQQQPEIEVNVPPMERGPFGYLPDILRRGTQIVFGNMQNAVRDYNEGFLDRLDGVHGVPRRGHDGRQENGGGGAINVNMDYGRAAFVLGAFNPFDRSSETPQVIQEPYKAPPAAKKGFVRTFGEEDVILCPMCGDELAIGKGDTKQQVWVVKNCGHVYCGECATNRSKSKASKKGKGKENEKKLESSRSLPFSICQVDDCNTKLASKAAMFPVYL